MAIQAVPSDCSRWPPPGSGAERSNTPMLSRPRKPPWKTFLPSASLRLTHHVKFSSSLWKTRSRNSRSATPVDAAVDLVHAPRGPRVHRRVDVAERPLVGRDLPVGVHVPLAQEQDELRLGELGVDHRQRDAVERQVPGGVPRVLPLVGHRDDVVVVEVRPLVVAADLARRRRRRLGRIAVEPALDVVVIELLAPQQAGEGLAHDAARVVGERLRRDGARRTRRPRAPAAANSASNGLAERIARSARRRSGAGRRWRSRRRRSASR